MSPEQRSRRIKELAVACGFERCGIAPAKPVERSDYFLRWLESGRGGSMDYLSRYADLRLDPRKLLAGAKSVLVVAAVYKQPIPAIASVDDPAAARGRVAMYAWGEDYHTLIRDGLRKILVAMRAEFAEPFEAKVCVDTAPLLEREFAAAAGIGWIGKNTMVVHPKLGSFFFLGAIVTTLELATDEPIDDHCGNCTACLDACPTGAFPTPYEMDATRCISYLTIEHRAEIDPGLQSAMGDWIFGCDICQDVCPFNRHSSNTSEPKFTARPPSPRPLLDEFMNWTVDDYRTNLRGSAMKRANLEMLKRNSAIAASNIAARKTNGSECTK